LVMIRHDEFNCKLSIPWRTKYPNLLSFGVPKNSPYKELINFAMLRRIESGHLNLFNKK